MSNNFSIKNFPKLKFSYYQSGFTKLNNSWNYLNYANSFPVCYYVIDGRLKISAGNEEFIITPQTLVIIPARVCVDLSCPFEDVATKYWMHFDISVEGESVFKSFSSPIVINTSSSTPPVA